MRNLNLAGDLTSYSTAENRITFSYQYDTAGRPTTATSSLVDSQHPATLAPGLSYAPISAFTQMNLGNGLFESRNYNSRLQPAEIKSYYGSGLTRYDFTYGYNDSNGQNNGNLMSWNSTGSDFMFNRSYAYDALNRLATLNQSSGNSTNCSNTFSLSWNYDAWGNRTDQTVTGGTCYGFHATVNSQNQLSESPFQYDAAGNLTNDGNHTYTYDAENRLISVDGGSYSTIRL